MDRDKQQASVKQKLADNRLAPSKKRGQNFLVHQATARAIVRSAGIGPNDCVVEVGVGFGALTVYLAAVARKVIGIELDRGLVAYHEREQSLAENVVLLHDDILKVDLDDLAKTCGSSLCVVANLPYSISNPFLFRMLDFRHCISQVTVMLQKEVAERLQAPPKTKSYGIPTVLFGCFAKVETLMTLGPEQFHPRPKVDSQVIRITFIPDTTDSHHFQALKSVVRAAFASRRKTALNNLLAAGIPSFPSPVMDEQALRRDCIERALKKTGLPLTIRGEALSPGQFLELARHLYR